MKNTSWAACALAASLAGLLPAAAQAQDAGSEVGLQIAPSGLSNDGRRLRALTYDLSLQGGWWAGASLGYGNILESDGGDGVYGMVRLRYRFPGLPTARWVQPQLGVEYGGTTDIFDSSVDLLGVYGGVYMQASPLLGFTVDLWTGRGRFKEGVVGGGTRLRKDNVNNIRFGIVLGF